jgi:hypothetical protein
MDRILFIQLIYTEWEQPNLNWNLKGFLTATHNNKALTRHLFDHLYDNKHKILITRYVLFDFNNTNNLHLILKFSPSCCYFLCFASKYFSQHPAHKNTQSTLSLQTDTPSFISIKNNRQNNSVLHAQWTLTVTQWLQGIKIHRLSSYVKGLGS